MKQILTVAALVAGIGFMAIANDFRTDAKAVGSELARALVSGIILGANIGPYQSPAHIESRVTASGYVSVPTTTDEYSVAAK
jgi:hypothetical protein